MTISAESIVQRALAQKGKEYVFGAEAKSADPPAFDCSELVEWACAQNQLSPAMPDGTWGQHTHCRAHDAMIPIDDAISTRGALLFNHRDAAGNPTDDMSRRPETAHVAFSLGDGKTIEAMGTAWGVCVGNASGRSWTHAALIPGAVYERPAEPVAQPLATAHPKPAPSGEPWMEVGSVGDNVRRLQELLIEFGADRAPKHLASGRFTELTDIAVRLVQEHVRANYDPTMEVEGRCGPITWGWIHHLGTPGAVLAAGQAPPPRPDLAWLEQGVDDPDSVTVLQRALTAIGANRLTSLTANGTFGTLTDLGVRLFQWHIKTAHDGSMDVDGICGPVTWSWLNKLVEVDRLAREAIGRHASAAR